MMARWLGLALRSMWERVVELDCCRSMLSCRNHLVGFDAWRIPCGRGFYSGLFLGVGLVGVQLVSGCYNERLPSWGVLRLAGPWGVMSFAIRLQSGCVVGRISRFYNGYWDTLVCLPRQFT